MTLNLTPAHETIIAMLEADDAGADALPFVVMSAGVPVDITNCTFWFRVLGDSNGGDAGALLVSTNEGAATGVRVVDPLIGSCEVDVTAEQKALLGRGTFYYKLHMRDGTNVDSVVARGPYVVV